LYFEANDGINGVELWASNGTDTGTFTVKDLNTAGSSDLIGFFEFNNQLFFSAIDGSHGREPWMSDGSADGTQLLLDINPAGNSMPGYFNFVMIPKVYDGKLYFVADEGTNGYELWVTDGSATGTQIIEPSAVTGVSPLNSSNQFEISGDAMYFDANYDGTGEDLYRVVTGSSGIYYANSVTGKVEVYPNPSSGNFQIKFTSSRNADVKIAIFNVLDEKIWEKIILMKEGENSLSFADHKLEPGIYFLTLTDNKNKITRKIFIQ
jgi:ELWxxDGT repeat protein